jgi:hypothetical protein
MSRKKEWKVDSKNKTARINFAHKGTKKRAYIYIRNWKGKYYVKADQIERALEKLCSTSDEYKNISAGKYQNVIEDYLNCSKSELKKKIYFLELK